MEGLLLCSCFPDCGAISHFAFAEHKERYKAYLTGTLLSTSLSTTLTTTLTGFLSPLLTNPPTTASVTLALKRPVLLCFGKRAIIPVSTSSNPKSSNRSASSSTSISNVSPETPTYRLPNNSSNLPGVPTRISGLSLRKACKSLRPSPSPPRNNCAFNNPPSSSSSGGGGWNCSKEDKTENICPANSLVGIMIIPPT